jgi:hypothetical protein
MAADLSPGDAEMRKRFAVSLVAGCCLVVAVLAWQDKKAPESYLDPTKVPDDFRIQGEYTGMIDGKKPLAAQVIARDGGKFEVVFLAGGLPGQGWDGKTRIAAAGVLVKESPVFARVEGKGWTGQCTLGTEATFEGKTDQGEVFSLRRVVRQSPLLGAKPPKDALILFDGTNLNEWNNGKMIEEPGREENSKERLLAPGATTKKTFRNFKLHVEFRLPFRPGAKGQSRSNSGVYLQNRYEVQILDSFGLLGRNNDCGALYEQTAPSVNVCFPPLSWQTYDIEFRAARFEGGKKTANAVVTVVHNGVTIHDKVELKSQTGNGRKEEDKPGPINLQNHGNAVYFRNLWLVPLGD